GRISRVSKSSPSSGSKSFLCLRTSSTKPTASSRAASRLPLPQGSSSAAATARTATAFAVPKAAVRTSVRRALPRLIAQGAAPPAG
ncbi:MAG: hypothetical protein AVDCRST_MAG91-3798, partial [uncultured Sphingomonadaceae bacterium]